MNQISDKLKVGTIGELLVQLRLIEHGIQAAPPLKDSGNDLIAIKGKTFRAIQVKTTKTNGFKWKHLPRRYHILALVKLAGADTNIFLDQSRIYLLTKEEINKKYYSISELEGKEMEKIVDGLFNSKM